ncbi:MAG: trigger factor [Chlorobium sp.]|nr:trigger factor [Chlorobium sp.]MCW8815101.1 trigger factor [Chlorobium sp.]MCW8818897.1 trigger factor [Ignavibacteriaceae bacterium]
MQKNINNVSDTEQKLEITLSAEEFTPEIDLEVENARKTIQIKGFRKGHVPVGMIKKVMGPAIEASVAEKLASKYFVEISESENIKPASRAELEDYSFDGDTLSITLSYEIHPEFEIKDFNDYSFVQDIYTVTDEDVEREINLIIKGHGTLVPVDTPSEAKDTVIADLEKLDASGNIIEDQKTENYSFNLEYLPEDNPFHKALVGKKAGEKVTVDIEGKEEGEETYRYEVAVKEVKRLELPELNNELVKEISQEKFESVEDFRTDVRGQLEQHFSNKSEQDLLESISARFIEENPVPTPSAMVDSFENMLLENAKRQMGGQLPPGMDENGFRDSVRPNAEKHARWMLISQKIAEQNALEVTDEDIKAYAEKEAENNPGLNAEELLKTYMSTEFRDYMTDTILKDKIYTIIKSSVTINAENKPLPEHKG